MREAGNLAELVGKTVIKMELGEDWKGMWFYCLDNSLFGFCNGFLFDMNGEYAWLLGSPILTAYKLWSESGLDDDVDSGVYYHWVVYRLSTEKGAVTLRFLSTGSHERPERTRFVRYSDKIMDIFMQHSHNLMEREADEGIKVNRDGIIRLCDHWTIGLEEDSGQVVMRIGGVTADGRWIGSGPVEQACITYDGWEVHTQERGKIYLLYRSGISYPKRFRGLWGSARREWAALAQRVPGNLAVFAMLWEDPLENYLYDEDKAREHMEVIEKWKEKNGIKADNGTLLAYATAIRHTLRKYSLWDTGGRTLNELPMPGMEEETCHGITLRLDNRRVGFYQGWDKNGAGTTEFLGGGSYMDIEEGKEPLFTVYSKWKEGKPDALFSASISYRIHSYGIGDLESNLMEIVKASYGWEKGPGMEEQGEENEKETMCIQVCNGGERAIRLGGNGKYGGHVLWPGMITWMKLKREYRNERK